MGGRTMPTECEHGAILDWGDFGPDPDDGTAGTEPCELCEAEQPSLTVDEQIALVESWGWLPTMLTAPVDCTNACWDQPCDCSGNWVPHAWRPPVADPNVKVTRDDLDGGFVAERIDLPGCISQGDTEAEALANLRDAAEAWTGAGLPEGENQ